MIFDLIKLGGELYAVDYCKSKIGDWIIEEQSNLIQVTPDNLADNPFDVIKVITTTDKNLNLPLIPYAYGIKREAFTAKEMGQCWSAAIDRLEWISEKVIRDQFPEPPNFKEFMEGLKSFPKQIDIETEDRCVVIYPCECAEKRIECQNIEHFIKVDKWNNVIFKKWIYDDTAKK